jgi:predicted lipoprotein with Yx(FWY)xxD motif
MTTVSRLVLPALIAAVVAVGCGDDDAGGAPADPGGERVEQAAEHAAAAARKGAVVKVVDSQFGRVIADRRGEAFYLFDREKGAKSRCYGDCAVAWPPVLTKGKPRAGAGAAKRLLGTTRRRSGKLQVTYAGHPLYYYEHDEPGTILCHDVDEFGGLWLVVDRNGDAVG